MEKRIIVKIKAKIFENLKQIFYERKGYWDDLFDAWNFPFEEFQQVKNILEQEKIRFHFREFSLPIYRSQMTKRERAMHGKYAAILNRIITEEMKLIAEIDRYENASWRGKNERFRRTFHDYINLPMRAPNMCEADFAIELNFHKRMVELKALRKEIDELHQELVFIGS